LRFPVFYPRNRPLGKIQALAKTLTIRLTWDFEFQGRNLMTDLKRTRKEGSIDDTDRTDTFANGFPVPNEKPQKD
jgi:hypothetical protein